MGSTPLRARSDHTRITTPLVHLVVRMTARSRWRSLRLMADKTENLISTRPRRERLRGAELIARHIGSSSRTTLRLMREGRVPAFRIGSIWQAYPDTLDAWLESLDDDALRNAFKRGRNV